MKAIVRETYGPPDVLHLEDVPRPAVGDDDVLVRVRAASANAGDWHLLRGTPLPVRLVAGLRKPKFRIIGNDIAGCVESVGRNVTKFRPGDEVFGELSRCGPLLSIGRQKLGNVLVKPNQVDLLFLKQLCEAGQVRPTIDRRFPLSDVPAAVRYVEEGRARGKVVITI